MYVRFIYKYLYYVELCGCKNSVMKESRVLQVYVDLCHALVVGCCNEVTVIKCRLVIKTVFDYVLHSSMFGLSLVLTYPYPNCDVSVRP